MAQRDFAGKREISSRFLLSFSSVSIVQEVFVKSVRKERNSKKENVNRPGN